MTTSNPLEKSYKTPVKLLKELRSFGTKLRAQQLADTAVEYPVFVDNLFKDMQHDEANAIHASMGISGEAGEILDLIKKTWAYEREEIDAEKLIEELGDLRFYYQAMINLMGLTDDDIKAANIGKLSTRYPQGLYSNKDANARVDHEKNQ